MAASALHSVIIMFWKKTAHSLSDGHVLQQRRFRSIFCDDDDAAASLLYQLYDHMAMPCISFLYGKEILLVG